MWSLFDEIQFGKTLKVEVFSMNFGHNNFYHTIILLHKNAEFHFEPKMIDKNHFDCKSQMHFMSIKFMFFFIYISHSRAEALNKLISIMLTNLPLSVDLIWLFKILQTVLFDITHQNRPIEDPSSLNEWNWHIIVLNARHIWPNHFQTSISIKFKKPFCCVLWLYNVRLVMTLSAEC